MILSWTVIGYIFHLWRTLYANLIGRIAFFHRWKYSTYRILCLLPKILAIYTIDMFSISFEKHRDEKGKQLVYFDHQNVNSLCSRFHYVNISCLGRNILSWETLTITPGGRWKGVGGGGVVGSIPTSTPLPLCISFTLWYTCKLHNLYCDSNIYGLLTKHDVKMAGYLVLFFLRVYGPRRRRDPLTCQKTKKNKIAPTCLLGQPITTANLVHFARSRS